MGRKNKRKNSSEGSGAKNKNARVSSATSGHSVSDSIREANSVLFDSVSVMDNSVFDGADAAKTEGSCATDSKAPDKATDVTSTVTPPSASVPSICDIMVALSRLDGKISVLDKKLEKLDTSDKKVSKFDDELKKIWTFIHDKVKATDEKVSSLCDRVEQLTFSLGEATDQIAHLRKDKAEIQDTLVYMQSQSMRNNLIFANIPEDEHEKPESTETKLRTFFVDKLKLAQSYVDSLQLERVHRMGDSNSRRHDDRRNSRNIVAKFAFFKDREVVRRARSELKGTEFFLFEQFPKEVADRRRKLVPRMRQAIRDGKRAWLSYDKLFIDGRSISVDSDQQ